MKHSTNTLVLERSLDSLLWQVEPVWGGQKKPLMTGQAGARLYDLDIAKVNINEKCLFYHTYLFRIGIIGEDDTSVREPIKTNGRAESKQTPFHR